MKNQITDFALGAKCGNSFSIAFLTEFAAAEAHPILVQHRSQCDARQPQTGVRQKGTSTCVLMMAEIEVVEHSRYFKE
ncbi:MAG: hypothetical protein R3C11_04065 [Planctomycetaceae bacterium]